MPHVSTAPTGEDGNDADGLQAGALAEPEDRVVTRSLEDTNLRYPPFDNTPPAVLDETTKEPALPPSSDDRFPQQADRPPAPRR